jgi:predicted flap endonuclease-1-like 5' DNA nuclease
MQNYTAIDTLQIPVIYLEVFALMFVSFLIGYAFAFYYQKSKYTIDLDVVNNPNKNHDVHKSFMDNDLPKLDDDRAKSEEENFSINVQDEKSRERYSDYLDLNRLGYGSELKKDDLQRINGVGPFTEEKLNTIGIYTYEQISKFNKDDIEIVTELIKFFPDRIKNDKWMEQAKKLNSESTTERKKHNRLINT